EIHRGNDLAVIPEEGEPALGRFGILWRAPHPARDRSLGNVESQHQEFPMDARRTPSRILNHHAEDQVANLLGDAPPAHRALYPGDRLPVEPESSPMPTDDRFRADDDEGMTPTGPTLADDHPEGFVE